MNQIVIENFDDQIGARDRELSSFDRSRGQAGQNEKDAKNGSE